MRSLVAGLAAALLLSGAPSLVGQANAADAAPVAADPALEARAMALANELRCLVCQNQTIADSHADLAVDRKNQIREQLRAGKSDAQILDYMVARYGDFVLYRPPVKNTTALLWFGPFLLLVGALGGFAMHVRRRRAMQAGETQLNEADRARAREILARPGDPT